MARSYPFPAAAFVLGSTYDLVRIHRANFGCRNGSHTGFRVRLKLIDGPDESEKLPTSIGT